MKLTRFDPLRYTRVRDIPGRLLMALHGAVRGRFRFAGRLIKLCGKVALVAVGLIAITGCTHTRYVPIKCLSDEQYNQLKQAEPPKVHDKLTGRADQDIKTIAGSNIRLRGWGQGMLGVLEGCKG